MYTSIICLTKDNDDLVCHCTCRDAAIAYPGQLACAWCGSGWLFICIDCGKTFTFARGIEIDDSWEVLARHDLIGFGGKEPSPHHIQERAEAMRALLADVKVGQRYVYLDGVIIPADAASVHFTGWHARHDLDYVPQVKAVEDKAVIAEVLCNPRYWEENAVARKIK